MGHAADIRDEPKRRYTIAEGMIADRIDLTFMSRRASINEAEKTGDNRF
jgi:hypothetical protein